MTIYHVLSDQGDFLCASGVAAVIAVWAWTYLSRLAAIAFVLAYLLTVASALLLKLISPHYTLSVSLSPIYVFSDGAPSGHMALATVVYGSAALFLGYTGRWTAILGQVVCGAIIAIVGITRVTLGAHTIPDVVAGLLLGGLAITIPAWVLQRRDVDTQPAGGHLVIGMAGVSVLLLMSGVRMPSTMFL